MPSKKSLEQISDNPKTGGVWKSSLTTPSPGLQLALSPGCYGVTRGRDECQEATLDQLVKAGWLLLADW